MTKKNGSAPRKPGARTKRLDDRAIRRRYRELLGQPRLSDAKGDTVRGPVRLFAQAICEYVWGTKVF